MWSHAKKRKNREQRGGGEGEGETPTIQLAAWPGPVSYGSPPAGMAVFTPTYANKVWCLCRDGQGPHISCLGSMQTYNMHLPLVTVPVIL